MLLYSLQPDLNEQEQVKLLELALRAATILQLGELAALFAARWQAIGQGRDTIPALLRRLVNDVSLSPYTNFVEHLLRFVRLLVEQQHLSALEHIDFLGYILRHLGRHLTSYDLRTFHHRGANYPDALFLDAVLAEYLHCAEQQPQAFLTENADDAVIRTQKRLRRRALRQGWLYWQGYRGLTVPDAPTSPGENTRVLPAPYVRVPEEQILQTNRRRKQLFLDRPRELSGPQAAILYRSLEDLHEPRELQELGTALFIDRPLGYAKSPGEPDQTLLFACEAFSPSVARSQLEFLSHQALGCEDLPRQAFEDALQQLAISGLPARDYAGGPPRVVSLADAARRAEDFVLVRTAASTVREFMQQYPLPELAFLASAPRALIVPEPRSQQPPRLRVYDANLHLRLELAICAEHGYVSRGGREYPAGGLVVIEK